MEKKHFQIQNLEQMKSFAQKLAVLLKPQDLLALKGNLGAGKSSLARFIIQFLDSSFAEVPSPTFTLLQQYVLPDYILYHYDLYRLKKTEELYEIDIEDALFGVVIAEWPDLLLDLNLRFQTLICEIDFADKEEERRITLSYTEDWKGRVNELIT